MGDITKRWSAIGVVASVLLIAPGTAVRTQQAPAGHADLATIFTPGDVLQDRNGDGIVDFVNARIVMGEKPSAADVSAAADVAARFGFETMAMNLPLLSGPDAAEPRGSGSGAGGTMSFIIGSDGARRMGATLPAATRMPGPGDGMIATTTARGAPTVMVLGGDAAGTMAAAELLAGRLPRVWDPKGPTLAQVVDDVKSTLTAGGIAATSVSIPGVSVRAGANEIRVIDVSSGPGHRRYDKSGGGAPTLAASRRSGRQDRAAALISWCGLSSRPSRCFWLSTDRCRAAPRRRPQAQPGAASSRFGGEGESDACESVYERRPAG
jgi:hypothetical protein